MKQVTAILLGAGARGQIYANYAMEHPEELKIVAVAEPKTSRRIQFCEKYGILPKNQYESWEPLLAQHRLADAALVCTLDDLHTAPTLAALDKGYHVLLEKPMSNTEDECRAIEAAARNTGRVLSVCHVLRYTPFYQKLKELITAGAVGELAAIDQIENVGYWHQAHSFVRGNWRNSAETSPMILQKSCHDLDIILWLMGRDCERIASFGSLRHFTPENAPKGAPARCLDGCPHSESCPYYAPKLYLTDNIGWPTDMISTDLSYDGRVTALKEGPYGRCVYYCDNNVVDRQMVGMEFEGGAVASFTMTAFTTDSARQIKIMGSKGQITADMGTNTIVLHRFGEDEPETFRIIPPKASNNYGHGGGDYCLMRDFVRLVQGQGQGDGLSSARASLQSHLMCFAAERSRLSHTVTEMSEFLSHP
ncbi:Gfo/Idh/MocA family oxidoreductase [Hydrogenoanaerobacterium sp.]|uniref:Gfo/Idh/MocA family protein n=1 Tax=Hydrogenoanaerobacterium sp. TaxID=2953763 RepID=UPI0028968EC9|nr:Gfo/Idh/MocA family oxidoreductase [Hydrogenoanaerobacterium sp.]